MWSHWQHRPLPLPASNTSTTELRQDDACEDLLSTAVNYSTTRSNERIYTSNRPQKNKPVVLFWLALLVLIRRYSQHVMLYRRFKKWVGHKANNVGGPFGPIVSANYSFTDFATYAHECCFFWQFAIMIFVIFARHINWTTCQFWAQVKLVKTTISIRIILMVGGASVRLAMRRFPLSTRSMFAEILDTPNCCPLMLPTMLATARVGEPSEQHQNTHIHIHVHTSTEKK